MNGSVCILACVKMCTEKRNCTFEMLVSDRFSLLLNNSFSVFTYSSSFKKKTQNKNQTMSADIYNTHHSYIWSRVASHHPCCSIYSLFVQLLEHVAKNTFILEEKKASQSSNWRRFIWRVCCILLLTLAVIIASWELSQSPSVLKQKNSSVIKKEDTFHA